MKYYADYYNERVFAVASNGETECKSQNILTGRINTSQYKRPNDEPWMWEENGVGDLVEPMTKEEFESFGITWVWDNAPNANENKKHSWRNYIKLLSA